MQLVVATIYLNQWTTALAVHPPTGHSEFNRQRAVTISSDNNKLCYPKVIPELL